MSHTSAEALRTTNWVVQIGSKLARSACGTKRSARAAARCEIAGVASVPPPAARAPAAVFRNDLRSMCLPRARLNHLADTPEEGQRARHDAADALSPGLVLQEEAQRRIDHMVKCGLVQPARGLLFFVESLSLEPAVDLRFDLRAARPSEPRVVA